MKVATQVSRDNEIWKPNTRVNDAEIRAYGEVMYEIDKLLHDVGAYLKRNNCANDGWRFFRMTSRQISVALRKLVLDGQPLLTRVVKAPKLHAVRKCSATPTFGLESKLHLEYKYHASDRDPVWSINTQSNFSLSPLPGWTTVCVSGIAMDSDVFDTNGMLCLKLPQWLQKPCIKFEFGHERQSFTLGQMISYVANTEGAHVDNYTRPKRHSSMSKYEISRYLEAIGGQDTFTYPQWMVMFVALYLRNMQAKGMRHHSTQWRKYLQGKQILPLHGWIHWSGEIQHPGWKGPFINLGVDLNAPEQPPSEAGGVHNSKILSATEGTNPTKETQ